MRTPPPAADKSMRHVLARATRDVVLAGFSGVLHDLPCQLPRIAHHQREQALLAVRVLDGLGEGPDRLPKGGGATFGGRAPFGGKLEHGFNPVQPLEDGIQAEDQVNADALLLQMAEDSAGEAPA